MSIEKLEPRLRAHIDDERRRASLRGTEPVAAEDTPIEVTISHPEVIRAPEGVARQDRREALAELARRIRTIQRPILQRLGRLTGREPVLIHSLVNAVTARLTPPQLETLAETDEVGLIRLEKLEEVTCMNESVHVIELTWAWDELDADGDGMAVALLDSGADKTHPVLAGRIVDEVSTSTEPITIPGNHATHTAGTIVSNDPIYRGVAHAADLINIKVLTAAGFGTPTSVIRGLSEALLRGAQVGSMSLGWSELWGWVCNDADCILCQAADNAVSLGLTLVVAAGNESSAGARPPFSVRHPGAARSVITVGAVDKTKVLAAFSSIGPGSGRLSPSSSHRVTKPDVCAPGVDVVSSVLGGSFASMSGTSMATAQVAGAAALILQKQPDLTPTQLKKLLEESCQPLPYGPNETGFGLVSAYGCAARDKDLIERWAGTAAKPGRMGEDAGGQPREWLMGHPKLEPRLERELEVVEAAGQSERVIPVLIEHAVPSTVVRGQDRRASLEAVERRNRELQQGIVARLRELNGQGIEQLGLANAISVSLMPSQIRMIADHADVKIVRLARPEQVTA